MRSWNVVYARAHLAPGERRRARAFRVLMAGVNMARRNGPFVCPCQWAATSRVFRDLRASA
jgi:hypothetical protein